MRGTILLFSPILLGLGVGCASEVRVHFDERADFSRYHTWAWLPDSASRVDAPHANSPALTTRLARLIEDLVAGLLERLPAHRGGKPPQRTPPPRGESSDRVARRAGSGPVNLCAWVIGLPPGFFYGDRNTGAASL